MFYARTLRLVPAQPPTVIILELHLSRRELVVRQKSLFSAVFFVSFASVV